MRKRIIGLKCLCGNEVYYFRQNGVYKKNTRDVSFTILGCTHCGLNRTFPLPDNHNSRYEEVKNAEGVILNETIINKSVFQYLSHDLISVFRKYKTNGTILDFGCGSGVLLRTSSKDFIPYGIELSETLNNFCRNNGSFC